MYSWNESWYADFCFSSDLLVQSVECPACAFLKFTNKPKTLFDITQRLLYCNGNPNCSRTQENRSECLVFSAGKPSLLHAFEDNPQ